MAKKHKKKIIKKYKNKNKMCRRGGGGGGDLLHLLCLISNTLPQLEQSSLHLTTVLRHRLLLQTTCYNHFRLLLHLISNKGKQKQQQARTPPPPLARSQKGLRPFNPLQKSINSRSCGIYSNTFVPPSKHSPEKTMLNDDIFDESCCPVELQNKKLNHSLYADDLVAISASSEGLQSSLDKVYQFANSK